jgi:hypothetical protein
MPRSRADIPWEKLLADPGTRTKYEGMVYRRGEQQCAYWLRAISDSGHGKIRAGGKKTTGGSEIVSAHVLGYGIEHGAAALVEVEAIRHTCDSPSCQNPRHWIPGTRQENVLDYAARSRVTGHALSDLRAA